MMHRPDNQPRRSVSLDRLAGRRAIACGALACCAWLGGAAILARPAGAASRHAQHTITLYGKTGTEVETFFPAPGTKTYGQGALDVFYHDLYSNSALRGKPTAHTAGSCLTVKSADPAPTKPTSFPPLATCQVTTLLPGGSIQVAGAFGTSTKQPMVITGGTGRYVGAAGTAGYVAKQRYDVHTFRFAIR